MTKKLIGTTAALLTALALAACSSGTTADGTNGNSTNTGATGGVNFNLDLPNGETVSTINLHLSCPGIEQDHVLDVTDGKIVAAFGGLTPGQCTATMTAESAEGTDCSGSQDFTVVANHTTDVTVTLLCQGTNDGGQGQARITTEFSVAECSTDRIKKIYVIPANVLLGDSTTVEVETWPGSVHTEAGPANYSFATVNDSTHTGQGTFSAAASCAPGSAACRDFTCTGLGASPGVDPSTGYPSSGVWINVTVEDDDCFDTEKVWVDCLQASVCGDGVVNGVEQCDGTVGVGAHQHCDATTCQLVNEAFCGDNVVQAGEDCDGTATPAGQHCDASCHIIPTCGNGIVEGTEQCDGTTAAMTAAHQACNASCQIVAVGFCGDNIINQASEQCDGADTPAGQTCDASCHIVAQCGNGIVEGTEQCDGTAGVTPPDTCDASCQIVHPNVCKDCLSTNSDISSDVAACVANSQCNAVLNCITTTGCFYPNKSDCYCGDGADPDACEGTSFVPTGVCKTVIQAAAGTTVNADVLADYFDTLAAPNLANAVLLMDYGATQVCIAQCAF